MSYPANSFAVPMTDSITIRDATPDDAAVIAEIYNESIAATDSTMIDAPLTEADIRDGMAGLSEREGYMIMEDAGRVVGWGVIKNYGEGPLYRFAGETSVFLRRKEVRKGYGSRLKAVLIDRCRKAGYHHLVARVWASNEASIAYNQRFGYEVVGIQREIGHMKGEWQDVALLQLIL